MKSAGKARNNGLYRHIRTSKEIIRNLLNDSSKINTSTVMQMKGMDYLWSKNYDKSKMFPLEIIYEI